MLFRSIQKYSTESRYENKGGAVVKTIALMMAMVCLGQASLVSGAENTKYPAPRFPSYLRPPKSIDDVMPFARAAVRQTGGRTPLGLVEKGMGALIDRGCRGSDGDAGDQEGLRGTRRQGLYRIRGRAIGNQQRRSTKGDPGHALVYVRARLHGSPSMDFGGRK